MTNLSQICRYLLGQYGDFAYRPFSDYAPFKDWVEWEEINEKFKAEDFDFPCEDFEVNCAPPTETTPGEPINREAAIHLAKALYDLLGEDAIDELKKHAQIGTQYRPVTDFLDYAEKRSAYEAQIIKTMLYEIYDKAMTEDEKKRARELDTKNNQPIINQTINTGGGAAIVDSRLNTPNFFPDTGDIFNGTTFIANQVNNTITQNPNEAPNQAEDVQYAEEIQETEEKNKKAPDFTVFEEYPGLKEVLMKFVEAGWLDKDFRPCKIKTPSEEWKFTAPYKARLAEYTGEILNIEGDEIYAIFSRLWGTPSAGTLSNRIYDYKNPKGSQKQIKEMKEKKNIFDEQLKSILPPPQKKETNA